MADDKSKTEKGDDSHIDVTDQSDIYYWTKTLRINAETLKKVVASVGPMVVDVKKNLGHIDKSPSEDIKDTPGEGFGSLPL